MPLVIEEAIRGLGYVVLKAVSGGRYRSQRDDGILLEGGLGLLVVAAAFYVFYSVNAQ